MQTNLSLALAAVLVGAIARPALAAPPPAPLTLVEAVRLARDRSLSAATNRERLASEVEQRAVTAANYLPQLSVSSGATYNVLPAGSNGVGNGLSGYPAPGTYIDSSVRASQLVFDGFATRDALAVADMQTRIDRLGIQQAEQDAMRDAAVGFLQVLRAQGLADVAADAVSQAQEHLRLGLSKKQAGSGTRGDVMQLEAELSNAQASYMQAQNAVTLARLTLATQLNAPIDDRELARQTEVPVAIAAPAVDLAGGVDRREEVTEARLRVDSDRLRVDAASHGQWPSVNANSNYSQRDLAQGNFAASLNMSWPIYEGDKARHQTEAARHDAAADQAALEATRQAAALDIRVQYQSQQEAIARVATTRRGLGAAREAYRIALGRYRAGLSTLYELVDVQATLIQARGNYVQAVIDQEVAAVRLTRALGRDVGAFLGVRGRS